MDPVQTSPHDRYQSLQARMQSFKDWPASALIEPAILVDAGFFYQGDGHAGMHDCVECFYCGLVLCNWESGDDPWQMHSRWAPRCNYVHQKMREKFPKSVVPLPPLALSGEINTEESPSRQIVLHRSQIKTDTPVDLRCEAFRLKTYSNWPVSFMDPAKLSAAGFYYMKTGDIVRCQFCDIKLGQWELGDDPMSEHLRWSPQCPFVTEKDVANVPLGVSGSISDLNGEAALKAFLEQRFVRVALDAGVDVIHVKAAFRKKFDMDRRPFATKSELMLAVARVNIGEPVLETPSSNESFTIENSIENVPSVSLDTTDKTAQITDNAEPGSESPSIQPHEPGLCQICEELAMSTVFLPCGHVVACADCAPPPNTNCCPVCRRIISAVLPTFFPVRPISPNTQEMEDVGTEATTENQSFVVPSLETSKPRKYEGLLCKVCFLAERSVLFVPCCHVLVCKECAQRVTECPFCRTKMTATVQVYLP